MIIKDTCYKMSLIGCSLPRVSVELVDRFSDDLIIGGALLGHLGKLKREQNG